MFDIQISLINVLDVLLTAFSQNTSGLCACVFPLQLDVVGVEEGKPQEAVTLQE